MKEKISDVSSEYFWNENYIQGNTGWDLNGPTPVFKDWCDKLNTKVSIFVPGAGNGSYESRAVPRSVRAVSG